MRGFLLKTLANFEQGVRLHLWKVIFIVPSRTSYLLQLEEIKRIKEDKKKELFND